MKSTIPTLNSDIDRQRQQKPAQLLKNSNFSIFTKEGLQKYDNTEPIYHPDDLSIIAPQLYSTLEMEQTNRSQEIKFNEIHQDYSDSIEQECLHQNELISHFHCDSDSIYYVKNLKCQCENLSDQYIKKIILQQRKIKKTITKKKNSVTKNLPSLFLRLFFKVINQSPLSTDDRKQFIKFETSDYISRATIQKLKEFISVPGFTPWIKKYLESYQCLQDLLSSEKILDVATPIKFLKQIHKACLEPETFNNWTD